MDGLTTHKLQDLLGPGPDLDDLSPELRVCFQHPEDIALGLLRVRAQKEIRPPEEDEVQEMVGEDVDVIEELPLDPCGLGHLGPVTSVQALGRGQVMGLGADAADPLRDLGHLLAPSSTAEKLEAFQLGDLEDRVLELPRIIQDEEDPPVPLEPGYRVDENLFHDLLRNLPKAYM